MTERFRCTKDNPWSPEKGDWVLHEEAHEVGEQQDGWPSGDIIRYKCKNCGHEWLVELPQ